MDKQNTAMILDSAELVCLKQARSVGAPHLVLPELENIPAQQLQEARNGLRATGLLNINGQINDQNMAIFDALFTPEGSLTIMYDIAGQGRQELMLLSRQGKTVLITRPTEKTYRLEVFNQAEQIATFLKEVFPLGDLPIGERFAIPSALLERLPRLVATGELGVAKKALDALRCDPLEKDLLLRALENQKISGSMVILDLANDGNALDGFALAILADKQSIWLFHQPTPDDQIMIAQRNGALFASILDSFSLRLSGGIMLNGPLDKNKIATFNMAADEFALCFDSVGRKDIARMIINSHFVGRSEAPGQLERIMQEAGDRLATRGWIKINQDGTPALAQKLNSAISTIADYGFVLQIDILRPDLAARATIHVIQNRAYTSVLRPSQENYLLEHGDISTLPAYISKLFLDFGENNVQINIIKEKVNYLQLTQALETNDEALSARILSSGNLLPATVSLLSKDIDEAIYRGTIVRINADSHASQQEIDSSVKPLLLLLRGPQRSWLYHFVASDGEEGALMLAKNRQVFFEQVAKFIA